MKLDLPSWLICLKSILTATIVLCPTASISQDLQGIAGALIGAAMAQRPPIIYYQQRQGTEHRLRGSGSNRRNEARRTTEKTETTRQQHEAFLKIAPAAKELIEDASTFVRENPANIKVVAFIKKISALNSALAAEDSAKLKPLMEGLVGDLRHEPGYEKLEVARSKLKQEDAARYLPELIRTAKQQQAFIRYHITNNPTAPYTGTFIQWLDDLETSFATPDLEKLKVLTSKIDVSLREARLQDDFVKSKNLLAQVRPNQPMLDDDSSVLGKTEKNAFLVDGDPNDFVLLYNSSPQSPHVSRTLSGAITFEYNEATACLYDPGFDEAQRRLIKQKMLSDYKLQKPNIVSSECSRSSLLTYDVIAVERGRFAQMHAQYKIPLYSEVEANHFKQLKTITSDELNAILADEKKARENNIAEIEGGSGEGYGMVAINQRANTICMVVKDRESAHRQLLQDQVELSISNIIPKSTLDEAYKALQRNECQAIYASGLELKILTGALTKDGTQYSISVVWNTGDEIHRADKLVQAKGDEEAKQNLIAKTQHEAEGALRMTMNADAKARQEALQSQFGSAATAYSAAIAKDIRDYTNNSADWQQSSAYAQFPKFVTEYQNMVRNHWELQSFNSQVADYGHAEWKGRTMEAGFALINLRLRNRILGEYRTLCVVVGRMSDTEFGMMRSPTEFACDETAELLSLNKARSFESQWLVQPQS